MRYLLILSLMFLGSHLNAKTPAVKQLWETSQNLENPESAYYDSASKTIYVSNVAGGASDKDNKGWISKFDINGKAIGDKWFTQLNAPKGIRIFQGKLWVSDIDRVFEIDIKNPKDFKMYEVPGSKFLNDVAVATDGTVFISDTIVSKIYFIKKGKVEVFAEGEVLESPNGLLVHGPYLTVAGWGKGMAPDFSTKVPGSLYNINLKTKKRSPILAPLGNLDGLEPAWKDLGGFFVSDWVKGNVYLTGKSDKPVATLVEGLKGAADIGVIPEKKILLVPEMKVSKLHAYQID